MVLVQIVVCCNTNNFTAAITVRLVVTKITNDRCITDYSMLMWFYNMKPC